MRIGRARRTALLVWTLSYVCVTLPLAIAGFVIGDEHLHAFSKSCRLMSRWCVLWSVVALLFPWTTFVVLLVPTQLTKRITLVSLGFASVVTFVLVAIGSTYVFGKHGDRCEFHEGDSLRLICGILVSAGIIRLGCAVACFGLVAIVNPSDLRFDFSEFKESVRTEVTSSAVHAPAHWMTDDGADVTLGLGSLDEDDEDVLD